MKGIVLIMTPSMSQHVKVEIPYGITPAQFDVIMNHIKHDLFTTVIPQTDANGLVVTTYDEEETNVMLSNATTINAAKALIEAVGYPKDPNWSKKFFTLYGNGDLKVAQAIAALKANPNTKDLKLINYFKSQGLEWVYNFLYLDV